MQQAEANNKMSRQHTSLQLSLGTESAGSSSYVDAAPVVETTNWNAVKALAGKYGVELKSPDEIRAAIRAIGTGAEEKDEVAGDTKLPGVEEEEDLGIGTPFRILACSTEGQRTVYRFHHRDKRPPRQSQTSSRSGGSSSGFSGRRHRTPRLQLSSKSPRFDVLDFDDAGYQAEPDSPAASLRKSKRKQSHKSLRSVRSIPALRLWANASSGAQSSEAKAPPGGRLRSETIAGAMPVTSEKAPVLNIGDTSGPSRLKRLVIPPPERLQSGDVMGAILTATHAEASNDASRLGAERYGSTGANKRKSHLKSQMQEQGVGRGHASEHQSSRAARDISPFGAPVIPRSKTKLSRVLAAHADGLNRGERLWHSEGDAQEATLSQMIAATLSFEEKREVESEFAIMKTQEAQVEPDAPFEPIDAFDIIQEYWQGVSGTATTQLAKVQSQDLQEQAQSAGDNSNVALPGDDPRFSLWATTGTKDTETLILVPRSREVQDKKRQSQPLAPSKQGESEKGRPSSTLPTVDRATKAKTETIGDGQDESEHSFLFPSDKPFLIAATCIYLVAEMTSHIDNRFMTDFFYTYRSYMLPRELLQLLTMRFAWACTPAGTSDEHVKRKIVRVRTYVVLKYWLTNFFEVDFVPDAQLRTDLAEWLSRSSAQQQSDGMTDHGIVKSLVRLTLGLKAAYERGVQDGAAASNAALLHPNLDDAFSTASGGLVDLSLSCDRGKGEGPATHTRRRTESRRQVKSSTMLDDGKGAGVPGRHQHSVSQAPVPPPLPSHHGAFSRALFNTVSQFSKFKRHINTRLPHASMNTAAFEGLESDMRNCHDILFIRGGLEDFLDFFGLRATASERRNSQGMMRERSLAEDSQDPVSDSTVHDETPSLGSNVSHSTPASSIDLTFDDAPDQLANMTFGLGISDDSQDSVARLSRKMPPTLRLIAAEVEPIKDGLHHVQSDQTLRSPSRKQSNSMTASMQSSPAGAKRLPAIPADKAVVQIDDVDMSDDEDGGLVRRALRRLPGARDLRTAKNVHDLSAPGRPSVDSSFSAGNDLDETSRSLSSYYHPASIAQDKGSMRSRPRSNTFPKERLVSQETQETLEMMDPDDALAGFELVKGFRPDQLDASDDEEAGDVEAALLRLEGVVDTDKQRERQNRVEAMYLRSQKEQEAEELSDSSDEEPSFVQESTNDESVRSHISTFSHGYSHDNASSIIHKDIAITPTGSRHELPSSETIKDLRSAVEGRTPRERGLSEGGIQVQAMPSRLPQSTYMPPPQHRSFLLDYKSETIAQQFALIEMELFQSLSWRELISEQWKARYHPGQVLDWQKFYQNRARARVEAQSHGQERMLESSVEAIISRFNLTCNWIASEIVLTSSADMRAAVINKLIRIAWKCYHQSNFATLTQIILGLQSPWIERLSKTWHRVGKLELRMLRDLKAFINPAGNFKHLRNAMRKMIVQGHMEDLITSAGPPGIRSSDAPGSAQQALIPHDGCIPFFGLFLADVMLYDALPPMIDPTAIDVTPIAASALDELDELADPTAFTGSDLKALPPGMPMMPLVNLYKYRLQALTIKSILALQDRLESFTYSIDRSVYVKALKLRCLEPDHLSYISSIAEP